MYFIWLIVPNSLNFILQFMRRIARESPIVEAMWRNSKHTSSRAQKFMSSKYK